MMTVPKELSRDDSPIATNPAPFVSVVVPCLNERAHIRGCLDSLLANEFSRDRLEILVVDGMSNDGTREIVREYQAEFPCVRLLDNPERFTSYALNRGILAARGEIIVRIDAHATYDANYLATVTLGLDRYRADNVGGVRRTVLVRDSTMSLALSLAISHPFIAGNSYYRIGSDRVREVDTVFCGCYRRSLFERLGLMNERFIRAEDREFNYRLLRAGGKIVLDPSTSCAYYPRTSLVSYARWNANGAFYLFFNHRYTDVNLMRWRNLVPAALTLCTLLVVAAAMVAPTWAVAVLGLPVVAYLITSFVLSGILAFRYRSASLWFAMTTVFLVTHFGYGLATLLASPWYVIARLRRRPVSPSVPLA